jgi:hypothetical protein
MVVDRGNLRQLEAETCGRLEVKQAMFSNFQKNTQLCSSFSKTFASPPIFEPTKPFPLTSLANLPPNSIKTCKLLLQNYKSRTFLRSHQPRSPLTTLLTPTRTLISIFRAFGDFNIPAFCNIVIVCIFPFLFLHYVDEHEVKKFLELAKYIMGDTQREFIGWLKRG